MKPAKRQARRRLMMFDRRAVADFAQPGGSLGATWLRHSVRSNPVRLCGSDRFVGEVPQAKTESGPLEQVGSRGSRARRRSGSAWKLPARTYEMTRIPVWNA